MDNKIKYDTAFMESFGIDESALEGLEYESIVEWDSVGHMGLIAEIEEASETGGSCAAGHRADAPLPRRFACVCRACGSSRVDFWPHSILT